MPAFSDLFTGSAPAQVTSPIVSQTNLPDWYQQYLQGIAAQGTQVAQNTPWDSSYNQQVAGLTQPQWDAMNAINNLQGSQTQGINNAIGLSNQAVGAAAGAGAGVSSASAAQAQANQLAAQAGVNSQGYLNTANTNANAAVNSAVPTANNAATAAASNANKAVNVANQEFTGNNVSKYMSPYTQQVVNGLVNTANQNLYNTILPGATNEFIGNGQFGSTRNMDVLGQTLNQFQTGLDSQVAQTLQAGYAGGATQFNADQARAQAEQQLQANTALSGGQLVANTALSGGQLGSTTATNLGTLGTNAAINAGQLAANTAIGGGTMSANAAINAAQTQATAAQNASNGIGALTQMNNTIGMNNAAALFGTGQTLQAQNQQILNANTANAVNQAQYPWQQLNNLNSLVRGMPLSQSTVGATAGVAPNYTASPLAQVVGAVGTTMPTTTPTTAAR